VDWSVLVKMDDERREQIIDHATKLLAEILKEVLTDEDPNPGANTEKEKDSVATEQ